MIYEVLGWLLKDKKRYHCVKVKKVLILNFQGLGDNIMLTPLIQQLNAAGIEVHLLLKDRQLLIEGLVKKVHILSLKNIVKLRKFDLIYLSYAAGPLSALIFKVMRAKHKASHRYNLGGYSCGFGADIQFELTPNSHRVTENEKLLQALNISQKYTPYYCNADKKYAKDFFKKHKLTPGRTIGIHPGGDKNNLSKRYPAKMFSKFVKTIPDTHQLLVFLGPDEKDLRKSFVGSKVTIVEETLEKTAGIISLCKTFIHCDSGLGHVAAAMNVRTITLVAATQWRRTRPYSKKDKVIIVGKAKTKNRRMEDGFIEKEVTYTKQITFDDI